jgi:hypothetical protein
MYEKHFSQNGSRINKGIQALEKNQKKKSLSPQKTVSLTIKEKFIKDEDNQLEEPLSGLAMESLNTH